MADVSSATKFFPTAKEGFTTTTSGSISSGATSVGLNSVSGLTNGATMVFVIDPTDAIKKQTFTGVIDTAGSQVTGVVWTEGTNVAHSSGATVVDYETATHWALYSKGLLVQHTQAGAHTAITNTSGMTNTGGLTTDSVTASGNVGAATASTSGAATLNSVVTNTISANGANHVALSAGASKLVKTTVLRQDDTSNTYQSGNTVTLTGWGVLVPGATASANETVTFGVTFAQRPIVILVAGGDNISGTLTYGAGTAARKFFGTEAISVTTTNFVAQVRSYDGTSWTAGDSVFYHWMAIGEIA